MRWLKTLIPDSPLPVRILGGPFRGARVVLRPRSSMRKIFGVYEHELNPWLTRAIQHVERVVDVGANDGYFSIGCAAAFRRLGKRGEIVAFEPSGEHCRLLERSAQPYLSAGLHLRVMQCFASRDNGPGRTTLDSIAWPPKEPGNRGRTLIKIDVEGAEEEVLDGAPTLIAPGNLFLIEVHRREFLASIASRFARQGLQLERIDQRPLPLFGREIRSADNWWLVSVIPEIEST